MLRPRPCLKSAAQQRIASVSAGVPLAMRGGDGVEVAGGVAGEEVAAAWRRPGLSRCALRMRIIT